MQMSIIGYFFLPGSDAPGLPTYRPKNAAPAPTMVEINIAWALDGSLKVINHVIDL